MAKWFASLNGVVTLSAVALLAFVGYVLMEMRYFLEKWIPGEGAAMIETIVVLLIVAGWIRALFVAARGSRGGLIALLGLGVLALLIGIYDLQYVFGSMLWPEETAVFALLIVGAVTTAVTAMFLRARPERPAAG